MDRLNEWLTAHPITLVVFYASWSGKSIKAVPEILAAHSFVKNISQVILSKLSLFRLVLIVWYLYWFLKIFIRNIKSKLKV